MWLDEVELVTVELEDVVTFIVPAAGSSFNDPVGDGKRLREACSIYPRFSRNASRGT